VKKQVLKRVAEILLQSIREVDLAAFLPNDVYGVLLVGTAAQTAHGIGERIRKSVEDRFNSELTVSIGIASFPDGRKEWEAVLGRGIDALEEAERLGGNRVFHFESQEPHEEVENPRVLIVDDDKQNVKLLEALLSAEGYDIVQAFSGNAALRIARNQALDLVLLDIMMPDLDGYQVCEKLKCGDRFLPIVLITVLDNHESKIRGIEAGADDFITKPLNREEIIARTRSLINMRRLNRNLTSIENVLFSLASAVEAKDSYTEGHTRRVANLAVDLGQKMHLNDQDVESLRFGGILHDVGKIGVPGTILNKSGTLDSDEWEIMMSHTDLGYRICLPLIKTLGSALDIIRHHHEKLCGSGYPDGLRGDEISMPARIMGIVDIFDALTTDRPYRDAMSADEALAVLRKEAIEGKLDLQVVQALSELLGKEENIGEKNSRSDDHFQTHGVRSILIIDDNDLNLKLFRTVLKLDKYKVLEAINAEQGIELARSQKPDLILMDIQLPGMDGLEATRIIHGDNDLQHIPVVALTSYAMQGDEERAFEAGCAGYIAKPIEADKFLYTVSQHLQKAQKKYL
jgi:putative two-component system response regulator